MEYVDQLVPYWKLGLGHASAQLQRTESEIELVLITVLTTLLTMFVLRLAGRLFKIPKKKCCAKEFAEQRKADPVPPNNDNAIIGEIQSQLVLIHREIINLRHERELVDNELIETSTQILQSICASFGQQDEFSVDNVPQIELPKPVPQRMQPKMMQSPAVTAPSYSPVSEQRIDSSMQSFPNPSPPAKQASPPNGSPVHTQPAAFGQIPNRSPVNQQGPPPAKVAAPKMSAIAAARMKREAELAENGATAAPVGSTNPFGKPRAAPFGATMG